jgi:hypothetical protein
MQTAKSSSSQELLTVVGDNWSMNKLLVVHIHDNTYIHGKYESTNQNGSSSILWQVPDILDQIFGAASSAATQILFHFLMFY